MAYKYSEFALVIEIHDGRKLVIVRGEKRRERELTPNGRWLIHKFLQRHPCTVAGIAEGAIAWYAYKGESMYTAKHIGNGLYRIYKGDKLLCLYNEVSELKEGGPTAEEFVKRLNTKPEMLDNVRLEENQAPIEKD